MLCLSVTAFDNLSIFSFFLHQSSYRFVSMVDLSENKCLSSLIFFLIFQFSVSFISILILLWV